MKTKTNLNKVALVGLFIALTTVISGCNVQNEIIKIEDVSKVSLERLAEMDSDPNVLPEQYVTIKQRVQSLSKTEYEQYLNFWVNKGVQDLVKKGIIPKEELQAEIKKEFETQKLYDVESIKVYGIPRYKLSDEQQENILNEIEKPLSVSNARIAACPTYKYPFPVSNDGTGTYPYVGIYSVGNPRTNDCDWEIAYNLGNTLSNSKAKTSTGRATGIFLLGGINHRRPSAPENVSHRRFLVGQRRLNVVYPSSGYYAAQAFASEVKFR